MLLKAQMLSLGCSAMILFLLQNSDTGVLFKSGFISLEDVAVVFNKSVMSSSAARYLSLANN